MSEKIDTGGLAFPIGSGDMRDECGMTLLDYFAAKAPEVPKWFYEITRSGNEIADQHCIARWSYSYAQAMLAEKRRIERSGV